MLFLHGNKIHLVKDNKTTLGVADGYIYQCTLTTNCGHPIILPSKEGLQTTIRDRKSSISEHDQATLIIRNKILSHYFTHGYKNIPIQLKVTRGNDSARTKVSHVLH